MDYGVLFPPAVGKFHPSVIAPFSAKSSAMPSLENSARLAKSQILTRCGFPSTACLPLFRGSTLSVQKPEQATSSHPSTTLWHTSPPILRCPPLASDWAALPSFFSCPLIFAIFSSSTGVQGLRRGILQSACPSFRRDLAPLRTAPPSQKKLARSRLMALLSRPFRLPSRYHFSGARFLFDKDCGGVGGSLGEYPKPPVGPLTNIFPLLFSTHQPFPSPTFLNRVPTTQ